ncbi:MAG TPA: hypothetical protein VN131_06715 [Mobilitalea sp.]|nr:hypothetical protein [Mobilitalea sp.]
MYELTEEQKDAHEQIGKAIKEAVDKIVKTANVLYEWMKRVIARVKETLVKSWSYLKTYIMELPPKQRYKLLKFMGIKNYLPFFRRDGVIHCRNNC